ncbi:MAG: hypothetical protein D6734_06460 [Candidatus Schekmanbacteria bacterium]|nr:MAG: hypothetical protein D6734_06460 [Candidatus Schekmanbacteria bacterium]
MFFLTHLLLFSPCLCKADEKAEIHANIGPIAAVSETEREKSFRIPPLFGYEKDIPKGTFNLDILWPLINYKRAEKKIQLRVLPFLFFKKDMEREWDKKKYLYILPLYISSEKSGRKSRVIFPLYGHFEGWFGLDSFDFLLFPLYTASKEKEENSYSYCWPFFNYSIAKGKRYYRIWPFYGSKSVEKEYEKTFILWPFYNNQKFYKDDGALKKERLLLFPFFGSSKSDVAETKLFLFPLYVSQKKLKEDFSRYDVIWPLFSITRGKERRTTQVFPFFRLDKKGDSFRNFYLWPLLWDGDIKVSGYRKRFFSFVPLYLYNHIEWENRKIDEKLHKIWPLFSYRSDGNSTLIRTLDILPFNEKGRFGEGFYKNIGILFSFFEYSKDIKDDAFKISFFKGLFGYEKEGKEKTVRLLYFPIYKKNKPDSKNSDK